MAESRPTPRADGIPRVQAYFSYGYSLGGIFATWLLLSLLVALNTLGRLPSWRWLREERARIASGRRPSFSEPSSRTSSRKNGTLSNTLSDHVSHRPGTTCSSACESSDDAWSLGTVRTPSASPGRQRAPADGHADGRLGIASSSARSMGVRGAAAEADARALSAPNGTDGSGFKTGVQVTGVQTDVILKRP